jgi:hypothetical protein
MHYGKKGMHWGEWNEETRERYLNEGKLPDFPVPSGLGGKFGKSITETDVPGGVYSPNSDGEYYLDKEATERHWHANKRRELAEKTGQSTDPYTDGIYNKTATGEIARVIDNLIADPGRTLSMVARDTVNNGKNLVDGALGALKSAGDTLHREARYLTEGFVPITEHYDKKASDRWKKLGYTKQRRYARIKSPSEMTKSEKKKLSKQTNREARQDFLNYNKSAAKKVRNLFGYK